ncbi:hypothetical protein Pmar_PMAR029196 [Perkinsus marinus ATCC 50983]|uniref:Uncharacterized protein n=1 Tax=Perkinsus marinus (strain ATCC 50983 / TXsc) TaxID=423536 RepID=C5M0W5_PERM5|nr:hypothetical protein Pmar_PMAR029196 [Perkinsus marinus ATCC 50983]EEQ97473.1 hypothetical protein Pmar_PMAR029196 [Perkinsus marinus ATCC 50983]|eukprot:XP_002764756.1 hypothetical protein Pmar_PMAR029196 [Perkinsus marinus ATCC 50983]
MATTNWGQVYGYGPLIHSDDMLSFCQAHGEFPASRTQVGLPKVLLVLGVPSPREALGGEPQRETIM